MKHCGVLFEKQTPPNISLRGTLHNKLQLVTKAEKYIPLRGQNKINSDEVNSLGVRTALSMLKFYKREISPLMPNSCRYLPTCSEYSMIAYKKYGVAKGTILTAWRLCRCNPLGGSGFDPPRWFGETSPPEE
ncbi:hypothetical protein DCAR_0830570 [Daucus carota subsp. sativus]|uniref:Membrane protein insertion efficiency factor n=1 Tax=Daucus carota subsp. sativus TaxID=79200 RepID=A0AAF1BCD5_DAUCS|nr:hypothetical protein DCAR_0830570 [Daucus carota subsp. sativus]